MYLLIARYHSTGSLLRGSCAPHLQMAAASVSDGSIAASTSQRSEVQISDLLELGSFGAPHGVRGEVKLYPVTDSPAERLISSGARQANAVF